MATRAMVVAGGTLDLRQSDERVHSILNSLVEDSINGDVSAHDNYLFDGGMYHDGRVSVVITPAAQSLNQA